MRDPGRQAARVEPGLPEPELKEGAHGARDLDPAEEVGLIRQQLGPVAVVVDVGGARLCLVVLYKCKIRHFISFIKSLFGTCCEIL